MSTEKMREGFLSRLDYDPETGDLKWRATGKKDWDTRHAGNIAGVIARDHKSTTGIHYRRIIVEGLCKSMMAHRVIFLMVVGVWPEVIDHINGDGTDNRWSNLRSVSHTQNCRNAQVQARNSLGIPGVYLEGQKFKVVVKKDKKAKTLGRFSSIFEAACARKSFELNNGYHLNHGRKSAIESIGLRVKP